MGDTALVRHMIARVSMDTDGFKRGADRARAESQKLHGSFKQTFGRGIESLEVLGKSLRGGAVFAGMTALAFKAVQVKQKFDDLGKTFEEFPGVLSNFGRGELAVLQSLPMIGQFFDVGKEAEASKKEVDAFFSRVEAMKSIRSTLDRAGLTGNAREVADVAAQMQNIIDKLNELRRAADSGGDKGLAGTIDAQIDRAKALAPMLGAMAKMKPIIDEIKKVNDATEKVGRTEREVAMRRFTELRASAQAVKELGRSYDELERRQFAAWQKQFLRDKQRRQFAEGIQQGQEAKRLNLDAANPAEKVVAEAKELMGLFKSGLTAKGFAKRVADVKDSLGLYGKSAGLPSFDQKGTQGAFSAINQYQSGKGADKLADIAKIEADALKYMRGEQRPLLERMANGFGGIADI